ncbi:DUF4142 domain-containing protein [Streptomyces sp. NPDC096033]|uniref:DUF4142 domain-containing protein n=1 Tax=Streptomyces sp. NPDC096033 TaxID=3366071 RepID=UPI0037F913ED
MRPSRFLIAAAVVTVAMGTFTPAALAAGRAGSDDRTFVVTVHQGKAGTPGYDMAWLRAQADAHQATLKTIDDEIANGDDARVVAAAKDARPVVAMHLDMVRGGTCHVMG